MTDPNATLCYVYPDGSHGRASYLPEGAYQIGEEYYQIIEDNPDVVDVTVEDGVVHIRPSLISYKAKACVAVRADIAKAMPGEQRLNRLHRAVTARQGCFDAESGLFLDDKETVGNFNALVMLSNQLLYLESKYLSRINLALDVHQVDHYLEMFQRALQGTV